MLWGGQTPALTENNTQESTKLKNVKAYIDSDFKNPGPSTMDCLSKWLKSNGKQTSLKGCETVKLHWHR